MKRTYKRDRPWIFLLGAFTERAPANAVPAGCLFVTTRSAWVGIVRRSPPQTNAMPPSNASDSDADPMLLVGTSTRPTKRRRIESPEVIESSDVDEREEMASTKPDYWNRVLATSKPRRMSAMDDDMIEENEPNASALVSGSGWFDVIA